MVKQAAKGRILKKKKKNSKGKRKGPSCGEVWTGPRGKQKKKR